MRYIFGVLCLLIGQEASAKCCQQPCPSWWGKGWAITVYGGPLTFHNTSHLLRDFKFGNTGILAVAGSKKLGSVWEQRIDFELEAQGVQQFGGQHHFELNPIVFIVRWTAFPWNCTLPTTLAVGDGLSIATSTPKQEKKNYSRHNKVLNYVMAELTFSLPECPQWAAVIRYHHRSGMFGTFRGVHDASTALAAGFKYWF